MSRMYVQVADASLYIQLPNKKMRLLKSPFRKVDVHKKTFRQVLSELLNNGPNLREDAFDVKINNKLVDVKWSDPFTATVCQAVTDYNADELFESQAEFVSIVLRRRKQFYEPNAKITVKANPYCDQCTASTSGKLSVPVNLNHDTIEEVMDFIYKNAQHPSSFIKLIFYFNGKNLNKKRNMPLIYFGLTDDSEIIMHTHAVDFDELSLF
jgi:hypothetical protein